MITQENEWNQSFQGKNLRRIWPMLLAILKVKKSTRKNWSLQKI